MRSLGIAAEIAAIAAASIWLYAGIVLITSATYGDASLSFATVVAVIVLPYGIVRLLSLADATDSGTRLWGAGLSIALLYTVLRLEIAGDVSLWQLGWLGDLLSDPGAALEGRGGEVTRVVLLSGAWVWGVVRATRDRDVEVFLGEVSMGLVVLLIAVVFTPAADAPAAVQWLPIPYLAVGLLTLAFSYLGSEDWDGRRSFITSWGAWTGGSILCISALALLAAVIDWTLIQDAGRLLILAVLTALAAVLYAIGIILFPLAWVIQALLDWARGGDLLPQDGLDQPDFEAPQDPEWEGGAGWLSPVVDVLWFGVVALVVAAGLALLWLAFRRYSRRPTRAVEVREDVTADDDQRNMGSLLGSILGRFRRPWAPAGRDAIANLYLTVLRHAAEGGLPRPPAVTPLEFSPRLREHFASDVPAAISRAYAEARYGRRPPSREEMALLQRGWQDLDRRRPRA